VSRRHLLLSAAATAPLAGCDRALSWLSDSFGGGIPSSFEPPSAAVVDPIEHLLSRTSFGPRPGDRERVARMGRDAYIAEQLEPAAIDDRACAMRSDAIDVVHLDEGLFELPSDEIETQLGRHAVLRATYSRRQLEEVMVELWHDHFHVAIGKSLCQKLLPAYDRDVIRKHALGSFRELLGATAKSAAMLVYLDGRENKRVESSDRPNENYARELFELHTLGIHGGYSQADIMEAARCLTGFVVKEEWAPGQVELALERHDDGEKRLLGETIGAGGGAQDMERLLDIVAAHPSTATHVSRKIVATFIDDEPPDAAVEHVASTFRATRGDLRAVVKSALGWDGFDAHAGTKIKRPFRYLVSALRALSADTHAKGDLVAWLARMGHSPFAWPTPDGYPASGEAWLATLMLRFRFAFALTGGTIEGTSVDIDRLSAAVGGEEPLMRLVAHLLGRTPRPDERHLFASSVDLASTHSGPRALALALASPAFQRF
ncbi:MAG: DUF1800 domain-containing protein, partial [Myxococcales bacterium]|nr:DUF1800 domain-containing protein [Myxococcales bacterium]